MSAAILTTDDIDMIYDAADMSDMRIRSFPRWPSSGETVAVVGNELEFQRFLRNLGLAEGDIEDDREELLMDRLGNWVCEGVALSTVWYWPAAQLDEESADHLRELEDN